MQRRNSIWVGSLVRHFSMPEWGVGMVIKFKPTRWGDTFIVHWPKRGVTESAFDYVLEVVNESR